MTSAQAHQIISLLGIMEATLLLVLLVVLLVYVGNKWKDR